MASLSRHTRRLVANRRVISSLLQSSSLATNSGRPALLINHKSIVVDSPCSFSKAFQSTNATENEGNATTTEQTEVSEVEKKLAEEIKELKEKNDDLLDKYRRSLAENDNMRKRLTKQIEDAKVFGIQSFVKDLLDVADVLNRAVSGVSEESLATESQFLRDMHEGLKLTETQLHQVFRRHGLEQENPLNEKFDPNKHEAAFQIPAPQCEPNVVLDVQKVGYILHGRTVRPAVVGVSKK